MINSFKIFILLLIMMNQPAFSQVPEETLLECSQKLHESHLIDDQDWADMKLAIYNKAVRSRGDLLGFMRENHYRKMYASVGQVYENHPYRDMMLLNHLPYLVAPVRNDLPDTLKLRNYLGELHKAGAVSDKTFRDLHWLIVKKPLYETEAVLVLAARKEAFYEWLSADRIIDFAYRLKEKNILNDSTYALLAADAEQGKIENPFDLVRYLPRARLVPFSRSVADDAESLKKKVIETLSLMPEIKVESVEVRLQAHTDFLLSVNGKEYSASNEHDAINAMLAEMRSPYRLHEISAYRYGEIMEDSISARYGYGIAAEWDKTRKGLVFLTKEQAEMIDANYPDNWLMLNSDYALKKQREEIPLGLELSRESFWHLFSAAEIDHAIENFDKYGLLTHLTEKEKIKIRAELAKKSVYSSGDIFFAFYQQHVVFFDSEDISYKDSPQELAREFAKASGGKFTPSHITTKDKMERAIEYGFTFKDKKYSVELSDRSECLNDIIDLIHRALKENGIEEQFYGEWTADQCAVYWFLTPAQHEYLKKNKILKFNPENNEEFEEYMKEDE